MDWGLSSCGTFLFGATPGRPSELVLELVAAFLEVPTLCALAAANRSGKRVAEGAMEAAVLQRFPMVGCLKGTDDVKRLYGRCLKLEIPADEVTYDDFVFSAEVTFADEVVAYPLEVTGKRDLVLRTTGGLGLNSWVQTADVVLIVTQKRTGSVAALYDGTTSFDDDYDDESHDLPLRKGVLFHHAGGPVSNITITCRFGSRRRLFFDFWVDDDDGTMGLQRDWGLIMLENDVAFKSGGRGLVHKKNYEDDDDDDDVTDEEEEEEEEEDDEEVGEVEEEWYREEVFRWFPSVRQQLPYLSDAKDGDFYHRLYRQRSALVPDLHQKLRRRSSDHVTTLKDYIFCLQVGQTSAYRLKPKIYRSSGRPLLDLVTRDDLDDAIIVAAEAKNDLPRLLLTVMERSTARIALLYDDDDLEEFPSDEVAKSNRIPYARNTMPLIRGVREFVDSYNRHPSFDFARVHPDYVPADHHQKAHFSVSFVVEGPYVHTAFSVNDTLTMLENDIRYPSEAS